MTRFYLPQEVADLLKVSLRTVRRMIASKEISSVKIRRTRRIPEQEVERLKGQMEAIRHVTSSHL